MLRIHPSFSFACNFEYFMNKKLIIVSFNLQCSFGCVLCSTVVVLLSFVVFLFINS